jgi:alanine racemase
MHRVGSAPDAALGLVEAAASAGLGLGSVWTHLAVADEPGNPFTDTQLDRFDRVLAEIEAAGFEVPLRHAANSAGTIAVPRAHHDVVRCGVALYGMAPSPALAGRADLRPALRWVSRVSHVKQLQPGDRVSYGLRTEVTEPTVAATVPVGYADGYRRSLWRTPDLVLIGGRRRRVLGVVTMDQMVVDCGSDEVAVGDEVVLIGQQGEACVSADELASALDTINYEITCGISERVGRVHLRSATA